MKKIISLILFTLLSACGGGSTSGSSDPPSDQNPEGIWINQTPGITEILLIEPNGKSWAIGTNGTSSEITVGTVSVSGNNIIGNGNMTWYTPSRVYLIPGSTQGTVESRKSMTLVVDRGSYGSSKQIDFSFASIYDIPLVISPMQYSGTAISPAGVSTINVTLSANGSFFGNDRNCRFTGIVTSTGKNYNRVSLAFNGGTCALGTKTVSGVILGSVDGYILIIDNGGNLYPTVAILK